MQTSASGQRVVIANNQIYMYAADGTSMAIVPGGVSSLYGTSLILNYANGVQIEGTTQFMNALTNSTGATIYYGGTFYGSGAGITALDASNINAGTIGTAYLPAN